MNPFYLALLIILTWGGPGAVAGVVINDITQLNPVEVDSVVTPTDVLQVQQAIRGSVGAISIGGAATAWAAKRRPNMRCKST